MEKTKRIIAYLGKGGSGKTVLSSLSTKLILKKSPVKLLLVDADPAMGLCNALGNKGFKTIADVRKELITSARLAKNKDDKEELAMMVDYLILEALQDFPLFSVITMGRNDGRGCYCAINSLLRESLNAVMNSFDCILIDAEAGIEQVSRQVTERVDYPLIISDSSIRGVETAISIAEVLKNTSQTKPKGVIFNRCEEPGVHLIKKLDDFGISFLGSVPYDENIARFDNEGKSLLELPEDSSAILSLEKILVKLGII